MAEPGDRLLDWLRLPAMPARTVYEAASRAPDGCARGIHEGMGKVGTMDEKEQALLMLEQAAAALSPAMTAKLRSLLADLDVCDETNALCRGVLDDLIDATPMTTHLTVEEIADFLLDGKAIVYRCGDVTCVRQLGQPDLVWIEESEAA